MNEAQIKELLKVQDDDRIIKCDIDNGIYDYWYDKLNNRYEISCYEEDDYGEILPIYSSTIFYDELPEKHFDTVVKYFESLKPNKTKNIRLVKSAPLSNDENYLRRFYKYDIDTKYIFLILYNINTQEDEYYVENDIYYEYINDTKRRKKKEYNYKTYLDNQYNIYEYETKNVNGDITKHKYMLIYSNEIINDKGFEKYRLEAIDYLDSVNYFKNDDGKEKQSFIDDIYDDTTKRNKQIETAILNRICFFNLSNRSDTYKKYKKSLIKKAYIPNENDLSDLEL